MDVIDAEEGMGDEVQYGSTAEESAVRRRMRDQHKSQSRFGYHGETCLMVTNGPGTCTNVASGTSAVGLVMIAS